MPITADNPELLERWRSLSEGCDLRMRLAEGWSEIELKRPGHATLAASAPTPAAAVVAIINLAESRAAGQQGASTYLSQAG